MNKSTKKILSLCLALLMIFSLLPVGTIVASAATSKCNHSLDNFDTIKFDSYQVNATCTEPGVRAVYHCTICRTYFCSMPGGVLQAIESKNSPIEIPAKGHKYELQDNAQEDLYGEYICSTCGDVCEHTWENGNCSTCGKNEHEGHEVVDVLGKDPTCTEKGLTDGTFCKTCGKFVVNQKDIPAKGHEIEDGACTVCGKGEHEGHEVVDAPGKEATCTDKGLTDGTFCKTCGKFVVSQKDIPAKGHTFDDADDKCTVCGAYEHEGHEVVDAPGREATCTDKGLTDGTFCKTCGKFVVSQKDIPAKGHTFDDADDKCTVCGAYEHEGHEVVDAPAKEPTCTDKGLTAGTFCMTCGKFVVSQKDIPALGHNFDDADDKCTVCGAYEHEGHDVVDVAAKEATCTDRGLTAGIFCKTCGKFVENQKDIPALGHDYVVVKELAPTCSEAGYAWYECSVCGHEKNHEVGEPTGEHGETYKDIMEADCSTEGYSRDVCKVCGEIVSEEILEKNGRHYFYNNKCMKCGACDHDYVVVKELAPTCVEAGYAWYECSFCGDEMNHEVGEPTGEHAYEIVKELAPTCAEAGYAWYECSVCGHEMNHEVGEPTGEHGETYKDIMEADCSTEGYSRDVCKVCGEVVSEEILEKNGRHYFYNHKCMKCGACDHDYVVVKELAPTCAEAGYAWYECSFCGDEMNHEVGEPTGEHDYEETDVQDATCTEDGYESYKCTVCGDDITEVVGALGHSYKETVKKEATCTEDGLIVAICEVCGEVGPFQRVVKATGHDYEAVVTDPTCIEQGYTTYTCHCGDTCVDTYVDALGHEFGDWTVTQEPTSITEGTEVRTCGSCGYVEQQAIPKLESPFIDVPAGSFYYDSVLWAVENGITNGTSATTFGSDDLCLRACVVTFLWRSAGSPEPAGTEIPFVDVAEGSYYYKAVLWAFENGITYGMDATHFSPMENCNRAQVVTFLWRAQGNPGNTIGSMPFDDVAEDAFYEKAVLWAVGNGITNGMSAAAFGPDEVCNRAQFVTFLYRIYN